MIRQIVHSSRSVRQFLQQKSIGVGRIHLPFFYEKNFRFFESCRDFFLKNLGFLYYREKYWLGLRERERGKRDRKKRARERERE